MCNPVAIMWVGAAVSAVGAARQGSAQQKAQEDVADSLDYQAALARDNAQAEAELIRRQGRFDRGTTVASAAASGVKVGEGSALDAERQVMEDTEVDAAISIMNGERQARGFQAEARTRRRAGRDAAIAGAIQAGTTLLSRGSAGMRPRASATGGQYSYNDDASGWNFSPNGEAVRARR